MFYNSRRITKSVLKEINNRTLSKDGRNTIDNYQKLKELQQKEKIKDCFISRYFQKCGINNPNNELEEELKSFIKNKKLKNIDFKRIKLKINNILQKQKNNIKDNIPKSSIDITQSKPVNKKQQLTELNSSSTLSPKKILLSPINNTRSKKLQSISPSLSQTIAKYPTNIFKEEEPKKNLIKKKIYLKPEDELAELEKELGLEQEVEKRQKRFEQFYKYFSEGNEWDAICKYNRDMYEKDLLEEKKKKIENKKLLKEELDKQIKDKTIKEYKEFLENENYKKMLNGQQNKLALIEKEREEEKIKKLNLEKLAQKEQMKTKKIMQRLAFLKEKKFDKYIIDNIKSELEKEKKLNEEKKLKNFLEMKKIVKESEIKINQKREEKIKQKELEKIYYQDLEKNEIKKENDRKKILNKIKSVGDYNKNEKTKQILEKMKNDIKEEDEKINMYILTRKKIEDEKELEAKKRKIQEIKEYQEFLDNQSEEKKKEKSFEKMLYREQGRIWNIDSEKYKLEQKKIKEKIKINGIRNGEKLRKQIEYINKKKMKKNSMSAAEYSLNKKEINNIIDSIENEKVKESV